MRSYDEIYMKIKELDRRHDNNRARQAALLRIASSDWDDTEEGKEYAYLERINTEIQATISALHWALDGIGDNPHSQILENLASGRKQLLHRGG